MGRLADPRRGDGLWRGLLPRQYAGDARSLYIVQQKRLQKESCLNQRPQEHRQEAGVLPA